jgi:hypothetical protein
VHSIPFYIHERYSILASILCFEVSIIIWGEVY